MSAFTVEDQERQRKMNKMTDGEYSKMKLGDVQRIWKDFLDPLYFRVTLLRQFILALYISYLYYTVGCSTVNF